MKNEIEVFDRQVDGSVRPVSIEALAGYKQQHAAISKFFDSLAYDKDIDKASEKMDGLQKEIAEANKKIIGKK